MSTTKGDRYRVDARCDDDDDETDDERLGEEGEERERNKEIRSLFLVARARKEFFWRHSSAAVNEAVTLPRRCGALVDSPVLCDDEDDDDHNDDCPLSPPY